MSREWEDRLAGNRPFVKEDNDVSSYLGYVKEFGTSDTTNHTQKTLTKSQKSVRITNRTHPFVLPGLGKDSELCGKKVAYGIGIDGKSLGYVAHMCKRWEGPTCYKSVTMDKVFDVVFKLEAYAKMTGERPCHIVAEKIGVSQEAKNWDLEDYDTFHRRVYRHVASFGGKAGLRAFHPYKIHSHIKDQLRRLGYGVPSKGLWQGVRDNALNLKHYDEYYYSAPHDHCFVFPSFLKEHSDNKFFLKKIGVLETMEDIIKASYYLFSHIGLLKETEEKDNHPIVFFGELYRFKPETFLSEEELELLKTEIEEKMHRLSEEEKELKSNKDQFIPLHDFISYNPDNVELTFGYIEAFPEEYKEFWYWVINRYKTIKLDKNVPKESRELFIDDDIEFIKRKPSGIELVKVF